MSYSRYKKLYNQEKKIEEINQQLELMTLTDELTGLNNRRRTIEELKVKIDFFKRYGVCFTVSMIDIDHFKSVNDKYGHNTGDEILREFSGFLQSRLRTSDFIGRWGGEEFIIILPNTDTDAAYILMNRLQKDITEHKFNMDLKIAFSAGLCCFKEGMDLNGIINCADSALYSAKENGRNRIEIYSS